MQCKSILVGLVFAVAAFPRPTHAASVTDFADFSLRSGGTTVVPGRLYIPPEASAGSRPLILFLHGAGEAGTNNSSQVNVNIDNLLAEAKRRGAFLYAPQSTGDWSSTALTANIMTMVDRALVEQRVDRSRVYITGLSNGGGGTWNMLSRYATRFAAGVPICGVATASDFVPARLANQAIAAFHARNDPVVSVVTSRTTLNRILAAAGEALPTYPTAASPADFVFHAVNHDLNYVELATGGHGIWSGVYATPPLYDWLFAHTLAVPELNTAALAGVTLLSLLATRRPRTHKLAIL